jgi:hypothetical protein
MPARTDATRTGLEKDGSGKNRSWDLYERGGFRSVVSVMSEVEQGVGWEG